MNDTDALIAALKALGRVAPEHALPIADLELVLRPREDGLQEKVVPGEALFKKLVSLRDKLRVLEQRVNASSLSLEEKTALQAHITQVYTAVGTIVGFFTTDALPASDDASAPGSEGPTA